MHTFDSIKIYELISSQQEGSYWDFKREWYVKNVDMLHDIICMANNLEFRDAYIIIGVDDDYNVCGVANDPNRKNTKKIVDFLRDKKFVGGCRPTVSVHSICTVGVDFSHEIDVIAIHASNKTPYYLTEDYKENGMVYANNIYTRIQDTNTPVNRNADIFHIEQLWKNRFGLERSILEKLHLLLSDSENWACNKNDLPHYHKIFPEFHFEYPELEYYQETGEYEQNDVSHQPYSGFYVNPKASWYPVSSFLPLHTFA